MVLGKNERKISPLQKLVVKDNIKTLPKRGGFIVIKQKVGLFLPSQVRMWSRYSAWTFFTGSVSQVYCICITTFLAVPEDEAILAEAFFFYQVSDNSIYAIPA